MKLSLLLIAVFACHTYAISFEDSRIIGVLQTYLIDTFSRSVGCPTAEVINTDEAVECVKNIKPTNTFCNTFTNHFKPCLANIFERTKSCEISNDRGIKRGLLNSFVAEAKFICSTDGEHILELFNTCIRRTLALSVDCRNRISIYLEPSSNEAEADEHLCQTSNRFVEAAKLCFYEKFYTECTNPITKEFIQKFFDAKDETCNYFLPFFFTLFTHLY